MTRAAVCRSVLAAEVSALKRFLGLGVPADAYLLDRVASSGSDGFLGLFMDGALEGAAYVGGGMITVASATPPASTPRFAPAVRSRGGWKSVVGPEPHSRILVDLLARDGAPRVDRRQAFMAVDRVESLRASQGELRAARPSDLRQLVPMVARYRVEDRLAAADADHTRWIRDHVGERIGNGRMFVVERGGKLVFTGAFTFIGPEGAGLGGIYTVPAARGQGLGARATADLCRVGLRRGPWVTLHAAEDNHPAIRAYEKAGLRRHGTFRLTFR